MWYNILNSLKYLYEVVYFKKSFFRMTTWLAYWSFIDFCISCIVSVTYCITSIFLYLVYCCIWQTSLITLKWADKMWLRQCYANIVNEVPKQRSIQCKKYLCVTYFICVFFVLVSNDTSRPGNDSGITNVKTVES
jgi:hypothetical protein